MEGGRVVVRKKGDHVKLAPAKKRRLNLQNDISTGEVTGNVGKLAAGADIGVKG